MYNDDNNWAKPLPYSEVGYSHSLNNEICQDAYSLKSTENGWVSIVVCDGAGSAKNGGAGAELFSIKFCEALIAIANRIDETAPGSWINDAIISSILEIRNELRKSAENGDIQNYHCTLLAALLGQSGGVAVHVGDGVIFGGSLEENKNEIIIDSKYFLSRPENGEYLNETYFVTESIWTKHLRITPLPSLDWICLATDGGASLCLDNEQMLNQYFASNVIKKIINNGDLINYVDEELKLEKFKKATTDDKTVVLTYRKRLKNHKDKIIKISKENNQTPYIFGEEKKKVQEKIKASLVDTNLSTHENELELSKQITKKGSSLGLFLVLAILLISIIAFGVVYSKMSSKISGNIIVNNSSFCDSKQLVENKSSDDWLLTKFRSFDLVANSPISKNSRGAGNGL